ncbi:hypothetical protein LCGC14_1901540, partial [marine sediment metagenome]
MKKTLTAIGLVLAGPALAEGELNLYNWGNYTSPEMIEKFEKETGIKVTITDYDSNDTALAKIKAGGHGFDIVVPSGTYVPIFVGEGLLMESKPNEMENFKHMDPQWVDVEFDPGRNYTVPWQWGTVGVTVNTSVYSGDINTAAVIFDPPEELKGKINVVPELNDVMGSWKIRAISPPRISLICRLFARRVVRSISSTRPSSNWRRNQISPLVIRPGSS